MSIGMYFLGLLIVMLTEEGGILGHRRNWRMGTWTVNGERSIIEEEAEEEMGAMGR